MSKQLSRSKVIFLLKKIESQNKHAAENYLIRQIDGAAVMTKSEQDNIDKKVHMHLAKLIMARSLLLKIKWGELDA
jgi:hypothetical protein